MKKVVFFSFFVLGGLSGCDSPESPEFLYIENIIVQLESLSSANLHAEAILHNPNKNSITIKSAKIDILMEDKVIAILDQTYNIKAKGNTEFTIPMDVKIKLKDLNLNAIGSAMGLFGGKGQELRYLGKIRVKAYGIPFSVKVDYKDNINIRI